MSDFVKKRLNKKRRVLIVDDEEINRLLLQNILAQDYDVMLASNGEEALEIIHRENGRISLILLDLMMPVMDGFDFFEILKKDPDYGKIPVIVLTSDKEAEVKSLNLGVADFIPKPYDVPEVILVRIARTIQLFEDKNIIKATQFDDRTGLFNSEYFYEYSTFFDEFNANDSKDVIAVNVNRFHVINAMEGRAFGDQVLSCIAKGIKAYLEHAEGLACRHHADLFYLYLKSGDHEQALYESIVSALSGILEDAAGRIRIGVYKNADDSLEFGKKMDYALLACNSINGDYNRQIAYYDETIIKKEQYEEKLIHDLDRALEQHQFVVYFQPKYEILGEEPTLCSAEALIRWNHPELGMISPGVFIPLFENNGLISKVDRYVWKAAALQVARWRDTFGKIIPVSVNVSRVDMLSRGLTEEMKGIVKDAGIDADVFHLEVTESAYTDSQSDLIERVAGLRDAGFAIEMDDFGTGYSSLNMLTSLPFDILKLDMVFVRKIHTDEKALRLVGFILDIAKFLNVKVIAEGVENKEQYELLKGLGCDAIQGYYFSKPVPAEEFAKFIK